MLLWTLNNSLKSLSCSYDPGFVFFNFISLHWVQCRLLIGKGKFLDEISYRRLLGSYKAFGTNSISKEHCTWLLLKNSANQHKIIKNFLNIYNSQNATQFSGFFLVFYHVLNKLNYFNCNPFVILFFLKH